MNVGEKLIVNNVRGYLQVMLVINVQVASVVLLLNESMT
jgi:hypothetical protein